MTFSWLQALRGRGSKSPAAPPRTVRLSFNLTPLEDRTVPTFLAASSYAVGLNPHGTQVGDFNGDGKSDVVVVNSTTAGTVSVLLGTGTGTFLPKTDFAAGASPIDAAPGDFNADGKLDLAVVSWGAVNLLLGNGDGTFAAPVAYAVGAGSHSLKAGDFNNDGKLDIATMNATTASVLPGNGDGTFGARLDAPITGSATSTIVADFNHDGNLDLATSNTNSLGTVTVLRGHGDGTFDPAASYYAYSAPVDLEAGDFNNDGFMDLACPNSYAADAMSVLINNGDGTFAPPHTYRIPSSGFDMEVADFNGDGVKDLAERGGIGYQVQLGKGDGTFYPTVSYAAPYGPIQMGAVGDFNGDGSADLVAPNSSGTVSVVLNAGDDRTNVAGAVGFQVAFPSAVSANSGLPLTVTAVNATGTPAVGFLGTVYFGSGDAAAIGTAYTFTAADAGTHSFASAMRLLTLGAQTVTVSAPFLATATGSLTVTPAATRLTVAAPTTSPAGSAVAVTVTATDSLGNAAVGYLGTVAFGSTDVQAGLPAGYTFTAADAGTHTFTATLKTAGWRTVTATDALNGLTGSASLTISSLAATHFAVLGGAGAVGVALPLTVAAADDFGNADRSYAGTVHFTSTDPRAVLPADATLAGGFGTFTVTLLTVGAQTITATDTVTASITGTSSVTAAPPVPAAYAVSGLAATTAGLTQSFTVTVKDTINQVATGYRGTVYFTSTDWQAGLPLSYTFTAADAGVRTFAVTFKTSGLQSLTARDAATFGFIGRQTGIAVVAAAATQLTVSTTVDLTSPLVAGTVVPVTVTARDAFGNVATTYRGKVGVTSTDPQAGLPSNTSFTAADAGVHTFAVTLKTANKKPALTSISVVDTSNATLLGSLAQIDVTNGAAVSVSLAAPSGVTVGVAFFLKVTVLDAYGNTVKNYFGTLHFANTAGPAGLPTDYTFTAADAGVHSFAVTLATAGTQTISAADLADPLVKGNAILSAKAGTSGGGSGGGGGK